MAELSKTETKSSSYRYPSDQTWETFVDSRVKCKHTPDTRKLILDIMPHFPRPIKVIAGYLNDADQFWKVSYHWEYLVTMMNKALKLGISSESSNIITG